MTRVSAGFFSLCALLVSYCAATYNEQLTLRPLPRNTLLTSFEFESWSDPVPQELFYSDDDTHNYRQYATFPRSLGQVIEQSKTRELHLRFSQGWWDAESWGEQPRNGSSSGGIGVELWAWVEGESLDEAVKHWNKLVNSLSGLFCASLNFIDSAQTTFPRKSFQKQGDHDKQNLYLLRGALPREPVCTENLTPFIKLLPCKGKAGISSLLDGHKIFDAQWQGMSVDVTPECKDGQCSYKMTQVIDAVIDVARAIQRKTSPVPKPIEYDNLRCNTSKSYYDQYRCFPLNEDTEINWQMSDIFGRKMDGLCPLAKNSHHVVVDAPSGSWEAEMEGHDDENNRMHVQQGDKFKLEENKQWDVKLKSSNSADVTEVTTPPVYVERSFTGYGQDRGGIRTVFKNPSLDKDVRFVYFETMPWYMRLYLHTLDVDIRGQQSTEIDPASLIKDLQYMPAIDRKQPAQIEIEMVVPAATSVTISYDFDKTLLYLEEYPPDANRGFDIAPGVLTTLGGSKPFSIRTTSLLLTLPTPDFSMPYNVIILTCTVMALTFGTVFNLLVKRVETDEVADELSSQRPLAVFLRNLREKIKAKMEGPQRGPYPYTDDTKKEKNSSE